MFGTRFEAEIRGQPDVWRGIAASAKAEQLARAIHSRAIVLLGSGSSLFMAQLGALAFRRRGIQAHALAATEALLDNAAYRDAVVVAVSQSGRSSDVLDAVDALKPKQLIALTNDAASPLCARANVCIDVGAGPEMAIPATKSVTATAAILLWAAALTADQHSRTAQTLIATAEDVRAWLAGPQIHNVQQAAAHIARRQGVIIVAAGYGEPVANEFALKLKEASYIHAEGFSAGEFRHGSAAMLDNTFALIGIIDSVSRPIVARPLLEAADSGALRYVIGDHLDDIPLLGPMTGEAFNTLAWLVAAQSVALFVGRDRGVDSDAPRGLVKAMIDEGS
jgi:glucosamine--fructose-6-phosphate aminotransferase (isomerizing)